MLDSLQHIISTSSEHLENMHAPLLTPRYELAVSSIRRLRDDLGWPEDEPFDVDDLLHSLVRHVRWSDIDIRPGSAYTGLSPSNEFVTVLNIAERDLPERMRWTKAHEACHILLGHFSREDYTDESILCREADIAVTELLLPEVGIQNFIDQQMPAALDSGLLPGEMGRLKEYFGVSWNALLIRLEELKIQNREVSRVILTWRNNPGSVNLANPAELQALAILRSRGIEVAS